jgi:transposase
VVVYEASGNGFILCDELKKAGMESHVIAPNKIERSSKQKRNKNDDRDAERLRFGFGPNDIVFGWKD